MTSAFQLQISQDGIAELTFNLPNEKVNKLSLPVMEELEKHLDQIANNSSIKALKLTSAKEGTFIAGADLHSFEKVFDSPEKAEEIIRTGHRVFNKLQNLPFPTVAVINGACLGGGLECALSCTYRIATDNPKTQIGLPEVNLGLFPGWGGTQRLPRLVGLTEGLNMILSGKAVNGMKAWKIHLTDAVYPAEFLTDKSNEFVQLILTPQGKAQIEKRRKSSSFLNFLMESNPIGRSIVFSKAKKAVLEKTKGHYPSPLIALEVIEKSYPLPLKDGLKVEADTFIANIPHGFSLAKNLIGLFFIQEAAKKDPGISSTVKPKEIGSAAVIGAGTMGASIGWLLADHKVFTRVKDVSWEIVGKGIGTAYELFKKGVKARKITPCELDRRFQLISGTIDYSGFQHADIIIEAATENLDLKKKIFAEVESVVKENALIASNTSSLTIAEMSQGMKNPERFVGMHFFNPVHKMPLVEIVAGTKTTPDMIATAVDFCKKLGKTPIVVGDCPGFLVNRIFMQGANEVMLLLEDGYPIEVVEKSILDFGMPMGPLELADEVGTDVAYKVGKSFEKAYGERMRPAKLLQLMSEKGLYGRKNGKGFYIYEDKKAPRLNPEAVKLLNSVKDNTKPRKDEDVVPRFIYGMINESGRCLEEKVISRPDFLDLCLILGIGFPPFRGGLLRYADSIGVPEVVSTLKRLESDYGMRFKPCPLLERMAQSNQKFYN